MKHMLYSILCLFMASALYAQDEPNTSSMDQLVETKSKEWKYNPFRQSDNEMNMVGRSNPAAFLSRFGLGALPNLTEAFPSSTGFHAENIILSMTPQAATEFNVIPFDINDRVKFRLGVGFSIEFHLLQFDKSYHYYGRNYILSDVITVAPYLDIVIDDLWKFRWLPLIHFCSHFSGDFLGDPDINPVDPDINDVGQEGMGFEMYYARSWITAYLGTTFTISKGPFVSATGSIFSAYAGVDYRVPMWGELNFLLTSHLGIEVNTVNDVARIKNPEGIVEMKTRSVSYKIDPSFVIGAGIQIDRYSIVARYSIYRSKHVTTFQTYEQRIGMDIAIYH